MCGIVGAVAQRDITPILVEGLKRLEYRGYDSCGVAVYMNGELNRARSTQRVAELAQQIKADGIQGLQALRIRAGQPMAHPQLIMRIPIFLVKTRVHPACASA
ncbi:Glucosamine--fructose-6-phosphate aminotransferase [isomerizing] [Oligella urethralis]|uniref:Glutamine--fructose-6-phosphate aminotransferase [isomerizing] n=1 Tax=Oligella urethralis TaxID=90245 RepID=A0A2X1WLS4_9BURK|nr:Glucosamine--fructose-6-phosphate aminotransferase [isomerizing] [Oligella urethralis]